MKTPEQQQQQTPQERFHLDAALLYKDTCPQLSRFLMQRALNAMPEKKSSALLQNTLVCSYCRQWPQPDNHLVRLRPKKRPSARVQSILRRKARGKWLSLVQRNLLHCFMKSSSVLTTYTSALQNGSRKTIPSRIESERWERRDERGRLPCLCPPDSVLRNRRQQARQGEGLST